jgi:diguanylate cyclase (GGDEF)-like protein/PAS domain S-box-containing protein
MVASAGRTTLLLVEADDSDADRLGVLLGEAALGAFEVVRVTTLADATTYLKGKTADCALVALALPDAEGLSIVERLADQAPAVALVILTGREEHELGEAAIESGACDYISKSALEGKFLVRSIRHAILRKRAETSLAEAQSIAQLGSWELDLGTHSVTWTRELSRLFGFPLDEKPTYEALIERTHPDDRQSTIAAVQATLEELSPFVVDHRLLLPDGTVRWVRGRGRVELDGDGRPQRLFGTAQDITEQKKAEDALQYQALHDPLSGLPNRLLFLDRLGQALKRLARQPSVVAAIYLNVDRFKVINASLGHTAGDQLLLAMAARLTGLMRPGDTLARIGGDEFVMLCEGLAAEAEAVSIADRICEAVAEPVVWDGGDLVVTVSAGIALSSSASDDPQSILRDADAAVDRAKREGRGRSVVFAETMRTTAVGRLDTEMALRHSIAHGDMRVHYQPIVTLADGQILGHEALVRWAHPTRGLIGPEQFIAVAEETGLIVPLGAWVLREACLQGRQFQLRDPAWSRLTMSVNLSGAQLGQADLIEVTAAALHDSGLKAEHLQLEMTESVLMDDAATTTTILKTLKGLGVHLGVDDFGTGYSSLAYLRRFPVDVLKIDRSFVSGLGKDLEDSAVAAAVVSLCETLGLTTIAEGVESRLQRDCLIGLGCSCAQGYLFARPVTASECEKALDDALDDKRLVPLSPHRLAASRGPR